MLESILTPQMQSSMMFRLLFRTQDDRFEPEIVAPLLRALYNLDDESAAVSIKLQAMDAELRLTQN